MPFRDSAQTFLRDAPLGLNQGPVNFRDGQGFAVRRDSDVRRAGDMDGAGVCVAQGTTHELNLKDAFRARGVRSRPVVFERVDTIHEAFFAGRCDATAQGASALAGAPTAARDPAACAALEETISKEPLGPSTRNGDDQRSDIVFWLHRALAEAEELGVTRADAEERARGPDATAQRLLGASGEFGARLGLDNRWAFNAVRAVGNHGEVFERNLGEGSPLKLRRGLNASWTGGLMYAVPFRWRAPRGGNDGNPQRGGAFPFQEASARGGAQPEGSRMDSDRIEGAAKQVKGAVKDAFGKVTGDTKTQAEGKADKAEGKVQNTVGGAKDGVRDAVDKT